MSGYESLGGQNLAFVEQLYEVFLEDPAAVSAEWRELFEPARREQPPGPSRPTVTRRSLFNPASSAGAPGVVNGSGLEIQDRVDQLTQAYRTSGHLEATLDPLERPRPRVAALDPRSYGLSDEDLDKQVSSSSLGASDMTAAQVLRRLRNTYCRSIGVQFTHIHDEARRWLQERMESTENRLRLTEEEQIKLLSKLIDAEVLEQFIRRKYLGAKSFSLEGGESLIPLLDLAIERAAAQGVEQVVLGMAHRGRLSVLTNIMRKHPREIFREFDDSDAEAAPSLYWGRGDVKYHLGFRSEVVTSTGRSIRLHLAFNPSHLEFVGPVVLGRTRARQDRLGDTERSRVMAIVLHGDAAVAGQGVVQETLNLSQLDGYRVGGALHVVVNNQIGFTTPPSSSRSCLYATDVASMLRAPIFHVNGEHPESVAQVVQLALDYRQRFRGDVFIDMYCYRRHGHNEGDEPAFTQPLMTKQIRERPTVRESYLQHLLDPGGLSQEQADAIIAERTQFLEAELSKAREGDTSADRLWAKREKVAPWLGLRGGPDAEVPLVPTGVEAELLADLLRKTTTVPDGFEVLPKLGRILGQRSDMADGERPLDWAAGEALAFATLLSEGHSVRLSGQDCGRGTFSHRHAVLRDRTTAARHVPLEHLAASPASFEVLDSPLSEAAVLGFDYGYALDSPSGLTLWEAQFGDFCNGAQVIIDQFITSAEDKWDLLCGLVLLLPHGFEGQGPEHSSARLERFLQLCAEDNIQVLNLTTPAQLFHALRRQVLRPWRKPMVLMSPKSLLRHPRAVSSIDDLAQGVFQRVIPDPSADAKVRKILLCSGRVYYDLLAYREERETNDVAIVRVEQLYPFPDKQLKAALKPFLEEGAAVEGVQAVWVQEEPLNMGAWYSLRARFGETLWGKLPLLCVARDESASPATGSPKSHAREQQLLVARAFWT